jgi:hypothetical protein
MQIELNDEEAKVLVNLLDVAQKAAGLQASEACVHFVKKIEAAKKSAEMPAGGMTAPIELDEAA